MHRLHSSQGGNGRVERFIRNWKASGECGQVLAETLKILARPPSSAALFDTPKRLRPKVRGLAGLEPGGSRPLSQHDAIGLQRRIATENIRQLAKFL
jgi:hypothetical protein